VVLIFHAVTLHPQPLVLDAMGLRHAPLQCPNEISIPTTASSCPPFPFCFDLPRCFHLLIDFFSNGAHPLLADEFLFFFYSTSFPPRVVRLRGGSAHSFPPFLTLEVIDPRFFFRAETVSFGGSFLFSGFLCPELPTRAAKDPLARISLVIRIIYMPLKAVGIPDLFDPFSF